MREFQSRIVGAFLALGLLGLTCLPSVGFFILRLPVFFISPLRFSWPAGAFGFLTVYSIGAFFGKWGLGRYPDSWIWPEVLVLWVLFLLPDYLTRMHEELKSNLEEKYESEREEFDAFIQKAGRLKKESLQMEKQLQEIEHLYDMIKEAGGTLNIQEMIELAKESAEQMFDLPHFVIAILSSDGKRYDVRITSGCEESFFRSFGVNVESNELAAVLAREKQPVLVPSMNQDPRYSKWKHLSIRSFVFSPFLVQERTIGFLCSFSQEGLLLDEEKFSNLKVFCNQISIGLQKSFLYEKVQTLSITDGLTKLHSHRYFKQRLEAELVLASRYSSSLSLLMLDIDHFKFYNDTFGHVAGDRVLMEVAQLFKSQSDATHLVARYGGEEMVLISSEMSKKQAVELAEKIRKKIADYSFKVGRESTNVTVSIGVATYPQDAQSNLDLISKADQALYSAKAQGRNKVVAYLP